jgi:hypothetical protein
MRSRLLYQGDGQRSFAIVLATGDEALGCLQKFVEQEAIAAAQFTGIGAFSSAVLKYFDWDKKRYSEIPVREQVEVASLIGDVALDPSGAPALHIHLVLGKRDGSAFAGHLGRGEVRPTLEIVLHESPAHLHKRHDPETGLALIDPTLPDRPH